MKTNDLRAGTRVLLANGWYAVIKDNARGNARMCEVYGYMTEIGSVYSHDIDWAQDANGHWVGVEYTRSQDELRELVKMF